METAFVHSFTTPSQHCNVNANNAIEVKEIAVSGYLAQVVSSYLSNKMKE